MCDLLLGDTDSALRLLEEDERTAQQQLQQQQQALEAAAAKRGKGRGVAAAAAAAAAAAETAGEQGGDGWQLGLRFELLCAVAGGFGTGVAAVLQFDKAALGRLLVHAGNCYLQLHSL